MKFNRFRLNYILSQKNLSHLQQALQTFSWLPQSCGLYGNTIMFMGSYGLLCILKSDSKVD